LESLGLEYGDLENILLLKVWLWEYGDKENGLPWKLKAANACRDKGMKAETVRRDFFAD
jgi:hypothetical protein